MTWHAPGGDHRTGSIPAPPFVIPAATVGCGLEIAGIDMDFVITPVFQILHRNHVWLNHARVAGLKGGEGGLVAYDTIVIR